METTLALLIEHLAAARDTAEQLGDAGLIAVTECALVEAHTLIVHEGACGRTA